MTRASNERCRACAMPIAWCVTAKGKAMPLDPEPVPGGNIEIVDGVAKYVQPDPLVRRHVSHFSTCPEAASFRKVKR